MDLSGASVLVARTVTEISLGIIVPVILVVLLTAYGLYAGRERIIALILGLYPAALIYQVFPYWDRFGSASMRFWVFVLLAILAALGLQKCIQSSFSGRRVRRIVEVGIFSILATGLFFALSVYLLGGTMPFPMSIPLITSPLALFIWLILPMVALVVMARRNSF